MKPLWKVRSGNFAGWRSDNGALYDANGKNVGYFSGDIAYSNIGNYVGEIHRGDWIGKRTNVARSVGGARAAYAGIALAPYAVRAGLAIAGWEDPDF
jgi:hypothetical protein